jgi:hypothetical protein
MARNGARVPRIARPPPQHALDRPTLRPTEGQMTSMLQACWAAAVTLALYAFYCFWEAGRADLVAGFRHLSHGHSETDGAGYRARGRWAAVGALLIAIGAFASALR